MADRDDRAPGSEPASAADLYGLAPDQFVAGRNALARQLRAAGRRQEAAQVAKLRRPPPSAWALNQVARHQSSLIRDLLAAGQQLRAAMEEAVRGDASGLRVAQAAERAAVGAIVTAAADRLASLGRSVPDAAIRRLTETLRAAVVDDAIADQLRRGALDADQEAPGLGLPGAELPGAGLPVETPRAARADRKSDRKDEDRRRQERARRAELEANLERLERRAHRLRAVADEAAARASEARKEADDAETAAEAARRQLAELD